VSISSGNHPEMTCADFEQSFNQYVDDLLEPAVASAARRHAAKCTACNREVMRWQQTRILLSTAVADFASAVDLSSVRSGVEAALGLASSDGGSEERPSIGAREAAYNRGRSARPAVMRRGMRGERRGAGGERRGPLVAAFRYASAAAVSAAAAAVAVLTLMPAQQGTLSVVASAPASSSARSSSRSMFQPASFRLGSRGLPEAAPATYAPPPLARPETPHVDGLEAAAGHTASTWVQPRTNARVIWVQDRGLGAPIRTAGLDR